MYNLNTREGKEARIKELKKLISITGDIPGDHLSYMAARSIQSYLSDIIQDLESQLTPALECHRTPIHESTYEVMAGAIRRTLDRYYAEHNTQDRDILVEFYNSCITNKLTEDEIPNLKELYDAIQH